MKKIMTFLSIALLVVSFSVSAEAKKKRKRKKRKAPLESAQSYKVPYGMAGCGLGSMTLSGRDKGTQIGAFFMHLVDFQTVGITLGTSNCVDPRSMYTAKEKETFISINLNQLEAQAAQGEGQHLNALAEVFGCDDKVAFKAMSKNEFENIYSSREPASLVENYENSIKAAKLKCIRAG